MWDIWIIIIWLASIGNLMGIQTVHAAVNVTQFFRHMQRGRDRTGAAPKPKNSSPFTLDAVGNSSFYNPTSAKFLVNGSSIPLVDWNAGESYAGNLLTGDDPNRSLFFWFWPSINPAAHNQIVIWFNGGPGCSSLLGLLQQNGPILWQPGTIKPIKNPWSWHRLAHVLYIDQPAGTGFSLGEDSVTSQEEVVEDFAGFWTNFATTFRLNSTDIYLAGEDYAGRYCPYIADDFMKRNDSRFSGVKGMLLYSPLIGDSAVQNLLSLTYQQEYWANMLPFDDGEMDWLVNVTDDGCEFNEYVERYLKFPPPNETQPGILESSLDAYCTMKTEVFNGAMERSNPGGSWYQISQLSPPRFDPLSSVYNNYNDMTWDPEPYFNRSDVKQALHTPDAEWLGCVSWQFAGGYDTSQNPIISRLPTVIDKTQNVIISQGMNDMFFQANGTLLSIQNMTWGQRRGFTEPPSIPLYVPYHEGKPTVLPPGSSEDDFDLISSGQGIMGSTITERGLTFNLVMLSGHSTAEYQPALAYRQVEVLLGRVAGMNSSDPFVVSADPGNFTGAIPQPGGIGKGTGPRFGSDWHP